MNSNNILGPKLDVLLDFAREMQPKVYIEIGCFRCDTMVAVKENIPSVETFVGFDLFRRANKHEIAPGDEPITLSGAQKKCPWATFYKGDTNNTLVHLEDYKDLEDILVFIDGGHSAMTTFHDISMTGYFLPQARIVVDDSDMPTVNEGIEMTGREYHYLHQGLSLTEVSNKV